MITQIKSDPKDSNLLRARENGGQVIWATSSIENTLEVIITNYLFNPIGFNNQRDFFVNNIIALGCFSFFEKKNVVCVLINEKNLLGGTDCTKLQEQLTNVMRYRNAFAHGKIIIDSNKGCVIEYFSGTKKSNILDDDYWNKLEKTFKIVTDLLNKAMKKLYTLNQSST